MGYFFDDYKSLHNINKINIEDSLQIFVCVNNDFKNFLSNQIMQDINRLNELFNEIGLKERNILIKN
ncbi:hypothetical protein FBBAL38_13140 [Flavobacteria bacterium BAL38]|nr:hypothetical protein FBBAL38_13140 [Flavobacteria bacterium BAL38]